MIRKAIAHDPVRPRPDVTSPVLQFRAGRYTPVDDVLAAEEPLEIRLAWEGDGAPELKSIAVTMRTPGDDFALAAGFLYGEGIVRDNRDIVDIAFCVDEAEEQQFNIVTVTLRPGLSFDVSRLDRNFFTSSSCGVCGKATLEALDVIGCEMLPAGFSLPAAALMQLPGAIREAQAIFSRTGGLHAAAFFDAEGAILDVREDVGRHNAFDKLVGAALLSGSLDAAARGVVLSGRASFELLQKALMARVPLVVAIGAPSSLAVSLAEEFGITLVGFTRADSFNVYTHPQRIAGAPVAAEVS